MKRAAAGAAAGCGAALLGVAGLELIPGGLGVALSAGERGALMGWTAGALGSLGLGLGLIAGWRDPRGAAVAAPLPLLGLMALSAGPRVGELAPRVHPAWAAAVVGGLVGLAALRGVRRARGLGLALGLGLLAAIGRMGMAGAAVGRPAAPAGPDPRPDVLLITLDTVRADAFAFDGGPGPAARAPALDGFAQGATVYTAAFSPLALTGPAHTTLLSGLDPREHGVIANGRALPPGIPWLPEELRSAGYSTWAFVSASVLQADLGFGRGFDAFDHRFRDRLGRAHRLLRWRRERPGSGGFERSGAQTLDVLEASGLPDLRAPRARPAFVWLHLYDAHWPYLPSDQARVAHGIALDARLPPTLGPIAAPGGASAAVLELGAALYRAQMGDLDAAVGRALARVGPEDLVVVAGDHGESLGEHGLVFNHGPLAYAPDTRVPLLVRVPGRPPARVDTPVPLAAVAPSVRRWLGLPPGPGTPLEEWSAPVVSVAPAEIFDAPGPLSRELGPWSAVAVRGAGGALVADLRAGPSRVDPLLDPLELGPGWAPDPRGALEATFAALVAGGAPPAGDAASAAQRRALEALGYLDPP